MILSLNMSKEGAPLLVWNTRTFSVLERSLVFSHSLPRLICNDRDTATTVPTESCLFGSSRVLVFEHVWDEQRLVWRWQRAGCACVSLALGNSPQSRLNGRTRGVRARGCFCWAHSGRRPDLQVFHGRRCRDVSVIGSFRPLRTRSCLTLLVPSQEHVRQVCSVALLEQRWVATMWATCSGHAGRMVTVVRCESRVYVLFGVVPWCSEKNASITEHHIPLSQTTRQDMTVTLNRRWRRFADHMS